MTNNTLDKATIRTSSGNYCSHNFHVYPKTYAGSPEYAEQFFNTCLCGKKRKIIIVKEVDNA